MKSKVHPKYYKKAKVVCVCGHEFTTGSTKKLIRIEVCSACHPFFTGEQKYVDVMGRVERFQEQQKQAGRYEAVKKKKAEKKEKKEKSAPKTLREMLVAQRKKA